ncbi:large ribosomal subunit protein bL32m [Euwallacea similis]|uniref:large ribosomal subunit protein bL32m n=1 Tax=Euwallacea similis TaxID=1736056 RepID=UPI00344EF511
MALSTLVYQVHRALRNLERAVFGALTSRYPPDDFRLCVDFEPQKERIINEKSVFEEIFRDGFLFAVPKHRRSIEARLRRKFGSPEYILKILLPKKNLKICNVCGDDHEAGVLCPTCYKKVIDETTAMQEAIQSELKLEPVEEEVVVMYEGEKESKQEEFWKGKRIVEMPKPRPQWFTENLLQKTTQKGASTSDVKPSDLG